MVGGGRGGRDGGGGCLGAVVWLSNFCLALRMVCFEDDQWAVWGAGRACRGPSVD